MNALYLAFKTTLVHQLLVSIITDQLIKHCHQWDKEYNARQAKQFSPNEGSDQRPQRGKPYRGTHYVGIEKSWFSINCMTKCVRMPSNTLDGATSSVKNAPIKPAERHPQ